MGRLNKVIDSILFHSVGVALALLVLICFVQVIARYLLSASLAWAEEVSVCFMMWATFVGASIAIGQGKHLRVILLVDRWSEKRKLITQIVLNGLALLFLGFVAFTSRTIIDGLTNATFFSLPWVPLNVTYYSAPAGCILMIYYLLRSMLSDWNDLKAQAGKGV